MQVGWLEIALVGWCVSILLATHVGFKRGFPWLGFLNGLVLGPLGLLNVLTTGDVTRRPCPGCAESIKKTAGRCPYCGIAI